MSKFKKQQKPTLSINKTPHILPLNIATNTSQKEEITPNLQLRIKPLRQKENLTTSHQQTQRKLGLVNESKLTKQNSL